MEMKGKIMGLWLAAIISATQTVNAQRILTYGEYIKNVREKNIEYIVEKYNVSIAEANTQAAKVFPDPEFSFSYENNQDRTIQMGQAYSAELGYTLELGGKRRARVAVAHSEQQVTEALVEHFFRNLRADATLCYLETLKQKQLTGLALSTCESMKELARSDSLRYALGEISEVDAMQTRLEANTMMTVYYQTEVGYKNMLADLVVFEGGATNTGTMPVSNSLNDHTTSLQGELRLIIRSYQLQNLIELAQDNRADLQAAVRGRDLSAANVRLAKANRIIDLGLNVGFA
ncbi:MAG: TolC family protein, partial [Tannerella sp.]|nr:TolC family protein [Tannerella sp.]